VEDLAIPIICYKYSTSDISIVFFTDEHFYDGHTKTHMQKKSHGKTP